MVEHKMTAESGETQYAMVPKQYHILTLGGSADPFPFGKPVATAVQEDAALIICNQMSKTSLYVGFDIGAVQETGMHKAGRASRMGGEWE